MILSYDVNVFWDNPWFRFLGGGSGEKKVALPPDPDPVPTPEDIDVEALAVGAKARRRPKGRRSLILTDPLGTAGVSNTAVNKPKSTVLGLT